MKGRFKMKYESYEDKYNALRKAVDENAFSNQGLQLAAANIDGAEVIPSTPKPAPAPKPTMSKDEIMKIKDPVKRQDAIAKNISLFK